MDRLEAMTILLAAVDTGSLSAASRHLRVPLATVSRRVAELEEHLNVRLLRRGSRKVVLTDAGQSYVMSCRRIIEEIAEVERTASGEYRAPRGELVITAPIVFGRLHVLPIVGAFLKAYPEIDVRITLADRVVNILEEHVEPRRGGFDFEIAGEKRYGVRETRNGNHIDVLDDRRFARVLGRHNEALEPLLCGGRELGESLTRRW